MDTRAPVPTAGWAGGSSGRAWLALAALTALGAALRLWGLGFGLPHTLTRPDEEAITAVATRIVSRGANPEFFRYPTLFMYLVALLLKLGEVGGAMLDGASRHLVSRAAAAALGIASVPLLFAATRRLFSIETALVAAALLAGAFLHVRDSHFGVTDVPAAFMIVLAFWMMVARRVDLAHWWNIAGAAALCGLAAATKYNAVLIGAPLVVVLWQQSGTGTARRRSFAVGCAIAAFGLAVGFLAGMPYAILARKVFIAEFMAERAHLAEGHAVAEGLGWVRHLTLSLPLGLGAPFLLAAIGGGVWLAATERRLAAVVLAFPIVYYALMGSGRTAFVRYMTPLVPFAALLAAVAVCRAAVLAAKLVPARGVAAGVAAVLTAAILYDGLGRSVALDRLLARTDSRVVAADWMTSRFPSGGSLYQTGASYGQLRFADNLFPEWSFDESTGQFGIGPLVLDERPRFVVVQRSWLTAYSAVPTGLEPVLARQYRLIHGVDVEDPSSRTEPVFDQQDAFFVPLRGFERFTRPGPSLEIYESVEGR